MVLILLISISLSTEPNEAEQLFRTMERKFNAAKTIACSGERKFEKGGKIGRAKLTAACAEGEKAHLNLNGGSFDDTPFNLNLLSNGKKGHMTFDGKKLGESQDASKDFFRIAQAMFARSGAIPWCTKTTMQVKELELNAADI